MLIKDMDIARLMMHVQHIEQDKLREREEFWNKKAKTIENESSQLKRIVKRSSFQQKTNGPTSLSSSQNSQNYRVVHVHSQGSAPQGGNRIPTYAKQEPPMRVL